MVEEKGPKNEATVKFIQETDDGPSSTPRKNPRLEHKRSFYEILHVKDIHGPFRKSVPKMPILLAIILCIFNFILPGFGTFISSFTVYCGCKTEHWLRKKSFGYNIAAAVLQLITTPLLVGYIWSIYWAVLFVGLAIGKVEQERAVKTAAK